MKKFNYIIAIVAIVCMALASCKTSKTVVPAELEKWQTAELPLKVELQSPMAISLNGMAYMERGRSAFFSGRMFGFEVGQVYVTPDQIDLVLKQPQKLWISQEMGALPVPFDLVQDALTGDAVALAQLQAKYADNVEVAGTPSAPVVTVKVERKGMKLSARLLPDLTRLQTNQQLGRSFEVPGSGYKKMDAKSALKSIGEAK